jgi:TATA-box binding protein (TBP) (component of TFIID and TFIIIB)
MAIVSSTAVFRVEEQDIAELHKSKHKHSSNRRLRRQRDNTAFHNVIFKYPKGKIVFLIYRNGKVVVLGTRSAEELKESCKWLADSLGSPMVDEPSVSNYVYTYSSHMPGINRGDTLINLYTHMQEMNKGKKRIFASLEPELSPALIYYPECSKKAKAMMFRSGKVTITGLRTESDIRAVVEEIEYIMRSHRS